MDPSESEFSANAAILRSSPPQPCIWAHLFLIDKWRNFCGADIGALDHEPAKTYATPGTTDILRGPEKDPYRRIKDLADGVAFLCAVAPDVTACAIEGDILESPLFNSSKRPSPIRFLIRVSRNGEFHPRDLNSLRQLLLQIAVRVEGTDWSAFTAEDKSADIATMSLELLPHIFKHCRQKIIGTPDSQVQGQEALRRWAEWNRENDTVELQIDDLTLKMLVGIVCRSVTDADACEILAAADNLTSPDYTTILTDLSLPETARQYLEKLARWMRSTKGIIRFFAELQTKNRQPPSQAFVIEPVERKDSLYRASEDVNEPADIDTYLHNNFSMEYKTLQPSKAGAAKDSWASARKNPTLLFHAELHLALYYALNRAKYPMGGYLAVSKKCCALCDFVLKGLQKGPSGPSGDVAYSEAAVGAPIFFCMRATHGGLPKNWRYPRIDELPSPLPTPEKAKLDRRLLLIRTELSGYLKSKVAKLLPYLIDDITHRRADESDGTSSADEDESSRAGVEVVNRALVARELLRRTQPTRAREE
ncbi:hypothetical protein DFH06DRAFT_1240585 [Mycena polygramma]|nr:hypothetical protein DFH06DRAFT_1240585 [Mycena polygramma]